MPTASAVPHRAETARRAGPARIAPIAATAAITMSTRTHGYQPGLRPSSTHAHALAAASPAARAARANQVWRIRHRPAAPMPTSAPIGGASAIE